METIILTLAAIGVVWVVCSLAMSTNDNSKWQAMAKKNHDMLLNDRLNTTVNNKWRAK